MSDTTQPLIDLGGRVAMVTGAGQGAGRAIALTLARHNAGGIAVNDFNLPRAQSVTDEIRALGVPAVAVSADVSDYDAVALSFAEAADALGPATILVNNAGNAGPTQAMAAQPLFWEAPPSDWPMFLDTNLHGVLNCCHIAMPAMVEARWGRVISIISDSARVGGARMAVYAAAKAGAGSLMRSLAQEGGRFGITANAISLSTLRPPMTDEQLVDYLASDRGKAHLTPYAIRRFGEPEDVAGMAAFLCSGSAEWITGQTIPVNGGYSFSL
jgi:NAD(P)-dependent dehydrogenase (short-subunit alcohol dehydrogenase family)